MSIKQTKQKKKQNQTENIVINNLFRIKQLNSYLVC